MAQLAVGGAFCVAVDGALIDQQQCANGVGFEEISAAAVIGQRGDRRDNAAVAHETAKARLHPVNRQQNASRHAVLRLKRAIESCIAGFALFALAHDCVGTAYLHEFIKCEFERLLIAVRFDRGVRVLGVGECGETTLTNTCFLRLRREGPFPRVKAVCSVAALSRNRGECHCRG